MWTPALKEEPGEVNWELELYYFCHWENGMFVTRTGNHKLATKIGIELASGDKIAEKIGFIHPPLPPLLQDQLITIRTDLLPVFT